MVSRIASNVGDSYSATLYSSVSAIQSLADTAKQLLLDRHRTSHPEFFLASVSERHWKAWAVAVTYKDHVVGIVYAKERLFLGCPTGIVYSDITLGMNIVAEPVHREHVLNVAIGSFLKCGRARALRVILPRSGSNHDAVSRLASTMDLETVFFEVENHTRLALPSSYDDFLNGLGARTRRNFRYYRRRFEAARGCYERRMTFGCFSSAVRYLRGKSAIRADAGAIKRMLKMLSAISEPILVGLRASTGEWVSVAGGWCEHGRATLLFQMNNDQDHHRDSISQVLRSYLIEDLVAMGIRDLFFWAGTSAPLARYAKAIPATAWYLDSRSPGWRLIRRLVSSITFRLPKRWRELGHWITPESIQTVPSMGIEDD